MTDNEFLNWLADRLVHVYGESPSVDFVHKLKSIALAKQEQVEPVAWADHGVVNWIADKQFKHAALLYEHSQQRTAAEGEDIRRAWVDLTDKDMDEAMEYWSDSSRSAYGGAYAADGEYVNMVSTWRYIEAKVKEKNT